MERTGRKVRERDDMTTEEREEEEGVEKKRGIEGSARRGNGQRGRNIEFYTG